MKERFLSSKEIARLRAAVEESPNPMLAPIVTLLLLTGCRKRELLNSTWDQFDLGRKSRRIPLSKSGKARDVPPSDEAVKMLEALPRFKDCPTSCRM
jgi:integrase